MGSILRDLGEPFKSQCSLDGKSRGEIVDFYLGTKHIAIEVDGPEHKGGPDRRRDRRLWMEHSIKTIRFKNETVLKWPDDVRRALIAALNLN